MIIKSIKDKLMINKNTIKYGMLFRNAPKVDKYQHREIDL